MTMRGNWLAGILRTAGVTLIALAGLAMMKRYVGEGMLNDLPSTYEWPVAIGALALGLGLVWLSSRQFRSG